MKKLNPRSGTSLQSVMIGLVLSAAASLLFVQMIKVSNRGHESSKLKAEMDAEHSLAFQILRRAVTEKITWSDHLNPEAMACLSGTGVNCQILENVDTRFIGVNQTDNPLLRHFENKADAAQRVGTTTENLASCSGSNCGINHTINYKLLNCGSSSCDGIELVALSQYQGNGRTAAPIGTKQTPVRVSAATVIGSFPTMSKDCNSRVDSINLSANHLGCKTTTDKSVCVSTSGELSISENLSEDGGDCRSLASITCTERQALGLISPDDPSCKDPPQFEIYSAGEFEKVTPPAEVTLEGKLYSAEKCEVCRPDGKQSCELLEVRKCFQSDGTQVEVDKCLADGFEEVLRYKEVVEKTCSVPVYPSCPNLAVIPEGRNKDGAALDGYTCSDNVCEACVANSNCSDGQFFDEDSGSCVDRCTTLGVSSPPPHSLYQWCAGGRGSYYGGGSKDGVCVPQGECVFFHGGQGCTADDFWSPDYLGTNKFGFELWSHDCN